MKEYVEITSAQTFSGRSIYCHKPVIKLIIKVDEEFINTPTCNISGFNGNLIKIVPSLLEHKCSLNFEGGFLVRLEEGTFLPHVMEHIIIEIQRLIGYDVSFGKTRIINKEIRRYSIIYEYEQDMIALECAYLAQRIINSLISKQVFEIENQINKLKTLDGMCRMGPSTRAIFEEAKNRNIPVTRLGSESILQLGYGKHQRLIQAAMTDALSCISADIVTNKQLTKYILGINNLPVAEGMLVYSIEAAIFASKTIGFPVVAKPYDANQGKGVSINLSDEKQLEKAFLLAQKFSKGVIIEEYIHGKDYRLLVVGGKVVAAALRIQPSVKGDGVQTIKELVDQENLNKLRGDGHEKALTKVLLDEIAEEYLSRNGMNFDYVPNDGQVVFLRENSNLSTGGKAFDCTEKVHPQNILLAEQAAKILKMDIAGIDIITENIEEPLSNDKGAIIEVNAAPGLRMHLHPSGGVAVNVAKDIIDMLFPIDKPFSIPIISVTGTNGKTTTVRLITHALQLMGLRVGMTCTSGTFSGEECIMEGDNTGASSARLILSNTTIEAAVLETARGGLIRKGLGYDLADVGIVTNISGDHLGVDDIETLEDMAFVKALVIEAVKPDGYSVINADDSMADYLTSRTHCNLVYFSTSKSNQILQKHISSGGIGTYVDNGMVVIHEKDKIEKLMRVSDIAISMGGLLKCNIENSLAAICALKCINVPYGIIKKALKEFKPDLKSNPGRFNIFDICDFKLMLDYGHNPVAFQTVVNYVKNIKSSSLTGIIGMPGDRLDDSIKQVGQMCAQVFDNIIIKEDNDLRGRKPCEVADIFFDAILQEGFEAQKVEIIFSETNALIYALERAQTDELIVMFYEELEPLLETIQVFKSKFKSRQRVKSQQNQISSLRASGEE